MYKLLIVDDESLEREAIKFIVKNSELEITEIKEATNGKEAVTIAEEFKPDIVTLDIKMPGLSGIEAGKIIKKIKSNIKIIFVTAYDSFEYAHEAIKIGVEEFIVKPCNDEDVIKILKDCINEIEKEEKLKKQKEKLEVKINQISEYLENEFVSSVVNGEIDEQQGEGYLKFMLNEFIEGFGVVIELDFLDEINISYIHRNMIKKSFAQNLSNLLNKKIKFMLNQVKNTIFILVFNYKKGSKPLIKHLIEDEIKMVGEELEEQFKIKVFYGFGECCNKISLLWKSFAQAKVAARNMLLDEVENNDINKHNSTNLEFKENELCLALLNNDAKEVIEKADYILDNIIFASNDINAIRLNLYEFLILLNRYLNKESQIKHVIPDYLFDDLKNIETRGEAKNYIHTYLFEILDSIEKQDKGTILEDKIIRYINDHIEERITLEDIAHEIGFSTYYFGKLFKKSFNMTFTEYLTIFRIEQAKKYLKKNFLTVKEVTYRVGYMDPNYFTRVFKKYEGITPTEYRNLFCNYN